MVCGCQVLGHRSPVMECSREDYVEDQMAFVKHLGNSLCHLPYVRDG
jgi:hypothetical protein